MKVRRKKSVKRRLWPKWGDCFLTKAFAEKICPLPCQTTKTNFPRTLPFDEKNPSLLWLFKWPYKNCKLYIIDQLVIV